MQYKSIFVSDIHIGASHSRSEEFLSFIRQNDAEQWFLVGDIIDAVAIKRNKFRDWKATDTTIVQKILRKSRKGADIYVFDSNHFMFPLTLMNEYIGNIKLTDQMIYTSLSGQKILINHGHRKDWSLKVLRGFLPFLGSYSYDLIIKADNFLKALQKIIGIKKERELCVFLKKAVRMSTGSFIMQLQKYSVEECIENNCDIIIQGHTHKAVDFIKKEVRIMNCGAWVREHNPTFIVEHFDGTLELKTYEIN